MNSLDLVILLLAVSAAFGGWRLGFLARAASWAGMAVGLVVAARFLPTVVENVRGDPTSRLIVAAGVLLGGAFVGQALGLVVGSRLHFALPIGPARLVDRGLGTVAGVAGVAVALWLFLPAMADVPGSVSRLARNSVIARAVDEWAPRAPDTLEALRDLVGEANFPRVFNELAPSPDLGPPPASTGFDEATSQRVARSAVKVEGDACRRTHEGSGFVVRRGLVVTNAHVVAGQDETDVIRQDGTRVDATVVVFDPDRDLALLRVPDDLAPPLPVGSGSVGQVGGVFGYPGGGPLRIAPFEIRERIEAVGRDLYNSHDTRRQVFVLASDLAPGDSGAAIVEPGGTVVGVAFAIAPDRPGTAYALTTDELAAATGGAGGEEVDTGPCLAA